MLASLANFLKCLLIAALASDSVPLFPVKVAYAAALAAICTLEGGLLSLLGRTLRLILHNQAIKEREAGLPRAQGNFGIFQGVGGLR